MKEHKFLKSLLSSLMALSVISTTVSPVSAEDAETENEEIVEFDISESEDEGEDDFVDESEYEEDEGEDEFIDESEFEEEPEEEGTVGGGAIGFDASADEVTVKADAPEGAFPEGTEMIAETVTDEEVINLIKDAAGNNAEVLAAVDITFVNEGESVQPDEAVKVALASKGIVYSENLKVVHVHEDEDANLTATVLDQELIETEDGGVAFDADSFSVYAVVSTGDDARLLVKFMNGTDEISSVYVKKSDIDAQTTGGASLFDQIVYDPGAGTLGNDEVFRGWTTVQDYTVAGLTAGNKPMDIAAVRQDVKDTLNAGVADGQEKIYYAMIFTVYNVVYRDEVGVVIRNDSILTKGHEPETYTIDEVYVPKTSDQEFQGWHIAPVANATLADDTPIVESQVYPSPTTIKITGSITLSVEAPKGYWLIFKENGKNVSYTSPQFLKVINAQTGETQPTTEPTAPQRLGYEFGGWYTNEACTGSAFSFGSGLTETTTLYAKWTAISTANYTVIIWKQNLAGDGYDFVETVIKSGATGTTPTAVNATTGAVQGATYNGETGFHFKETDQSSKTIAPEGNTVVDVYWDRNEHTLTFQATGYVYTPTTGNNGTQYGLVDGTYVELTRHGRNNYYWTYGDTWYSEGTRYNGTRYTRSEELQTIKTITALYGQSIGDNFPIVGTNGRTYDQGERWAPQNSSTYNQVLIYIDTMPDEDVTFRLDEASHTTKHIYYYVEALPGETGETVEYNGKTFVLHKEMPANYGFFTEKEDYLNFVGFTKYGYTPDNAWGSGGASDVYCYYTRNVYPINFMDGGYFDGNNNPIDEDPRGQLKVVSNIPYVSDLTSYNKGGDDYYEPTAVSGYVFSGWYIDSGCNRPYSFTTMPEGGVTVYAKWVEVQYRVFLHPNVPSTETTFSMGNQETSFRVDAGENINAITAIRDDYELVGWYTDEACTHQFNFEAYTLNDTNTTEYDKSRSTETDKFGNPTESTNKDVDRPWVTRCLDLYAKWRSKLIGAEGITVVYEAGDGTFSGGETSYTDRLLYKDLAKAVATTATTPTDATKKEFLHWVVQKYENGSFVDTNETVLPGDTFEVKKAYAQVTENEGSTPEEPSYTYTVKLRAEYKDIEEEVTTHIDWYANNGTDDVKSDTGIKMNEPIDIEPASLFSYQNYGFAGWARYPEGETPESPTDDSHLWLVYNADTGKFTCEGVEVKQVACDEKAPYHNLYAVWKAQFYVRFSSTLETKGYDLPASGDTFDLTSVVNDGYLYGGYYADPETLPTETYNGQDNYWQAYTPYTAAGDKLSPVHGTTYFLKEVPDCYLKPRIQYYYNKYYGSIITHIYLMTAVDDKRYQTVGFARLTDAEAAKDTYLPSGKSYATDAIPVITTNNKLYPNVSFLDGAGNSVSITAKTITQADTNYNNYIAYAGVDGLGSTENLPYNNKVISRYFNEVYFNYVPYYKTFDGVTVLGKYLRRVTTGNGYAGPDVSAYGGSDAGIRLLTGDETRSDGYNTEKYQIN
ncbi:MAG: InlB B-repeat-containing protein [Erysipelotrichaceae bacterium]|nr:InlB B-repeat-containing protein [Erysipelotrichaceae bacterium]